MANVLNGPGAANANSKISAGAVNTSDSWSFSAEDGNRLLGSNGDDWSNYGKWHLGHASEGNRETKAYWKYPFGKGGRVYRSALIAIRQRAGQQNDTEIFNSAGRMIAKIDKEAEAEEVKGIIRDPDTGITKPVVLNKTVVISGSVMLKQADPMEEDGGTLEIDILASTPHIDRDGDIIEVTAFEDAIGQFLRVGSILHQHNPNELVGVPIAASLSNEGLRVKARISKTATKVQTLLREGILRQASIGFKVLEHDFKTVGDQMHLVIKKLDLFETSLVSVAANPNTSVSLAKAFFTDAPVEKATRFETEEEAEMEENYPGYHLPVFWKDGKLFYTKDGALCEIAAPPVEEPQEEDEEATLPEASALTQIMQLCVELTNDDFMKLYESVVDTYNKHVASKEDQEVAEAVKVIEAELKSLLGKSTEE